MGLETLTAATAGGMAGVLTCPLDVVKTRIQTQVNSPETGSGPSVAPVQQNDSQPPMRNLTNKIDHHRTTIAKVTSPRHTSRPISTSSPSTSVPPRGSITLSTSSVLTGLSMIYKTEGLAGWFRGVGPRAVWTSVQSGTMLVLYQTLLRQLELHPLLRDGRDGDGEGSII